MKIFVDWSDNWSDEIDVYGWAIFDESEWEKFAEELRNIPEDNYPIVHYIGSNQELWYNDYKELMESLSPKTITDEDANAIHRVFGVLGYNFPDFM